MTGIRFRNQVNNITTYAKSIECANEYSTTVYDVIMITDSGTSVVVLPTDIYLIVMKELTNYCSDNCEFDMFGYLNINMDIIS